MLSLGGADPLSRAVLLIFPEGSRSPHWALKFARVRAYDESFLADERGLGLIAAAGERAAHRAPRLLGRFEIDGFHASVETAAVGQPLNHLLDSSRPRSTKLAMVDRVATWALELAVSTATRTDVVGMQRRRLTEEVLSKWPTPPALGPQLGDVPAVTQHNDLATWNVMVSGSDFCVVDWESAMPHSFPLWDLFYFLTDALARVDGARDAEWEGYVARLFRGDVASSAILFAWTRRMVGTLGIAPATVGSLATLCWMHHGLSHLSRQEAASRFAADVWHIPRAERVASVWLSDPQLGTGWDRWRA